MYPVLFRIGNLELRIYNSMLVIAFLVALWLTEKRAKEKGSPPKIIAGLVMWIIIGVVVGSRFFYVVMHWDEFANNFWDAFKVWQGGAVYFGGFIFAFILGSIYLRYKKVAITPMLDILAPSIALGEGIGRMGCFLNGCCFGKPSNILGVVFPLRSPAGYTFPDQPILPTQLFHAIFGWILFFYLLYAEKNFKLKKGQLFSIFFFSLAGFRFFLNFLRYYEDAFNYYLNQAIALGLTITGIALFFIFKKKS